eukprot:scaffold2659_cov275-Pinguiococcus_pyrenoidosus.AAC.2
MVQALEDASYFLDRALGQGAISLDVFLREVRKISRRQFMHRALVLKIRQMQEAEGESASAASKPPARGSSPAPYPSTSAPPPYSQLMSGL